MQEGALGLGTSLIYPPAFFATTRELIALSEAAAAHGGLYISHLRSEGDQFLEAVAELLTIAKEANIPAEIYHLKASGEQNWHKIDQVIALIQEANQSGLCITTNMYNYTAASTGLSACMPPWCQDGGKGRWLARLNSPNERKKIIADMEGPSENWENFLKLSKDPDNILLLGFDQDSLRYLTGKTLQEVASERGMRPAETIVSLIRANNGDISTAYFLMAEENLEKQMKLPYMSFGSDARSIAAEGDMLLSMTHPRTYGNFARLLGRYVREKQILSLEEAIHKLTLLPAQKFHIAQRGSLQKNYFADIVVFDAATITDRADYASPHQYAEGVLHVWVNGEAVLMQGEHTGARPGKFVKGPGYVLP
jgi:N-acyl-D-amino-acid deacylase